MFDANNILINPDAAKKSGLTKMETAYCIYDFLSNGCTDEEIQRYIDMLYGEDYDDNFMSMLITKFCAFTVSNTSRTNYIDFIKCLREKDCKSDIYTAISAYLEEWNDDDQSGSVKSNDPDWKAG